MKANQIVHWAGKDTAACEEHMHQLLGLGRIMGFVVTATPCEETDCDNCKNAAREGGK